MKLNRELPIWSRAIVPLIVGLIMVVAGNTYPDNGTDAETNRKLIIFGSVFSIFGFLGLIYSFWKIRTDPEHGRFLRMTDSEFKREEKWILDKSDKILEKAEEVRKNKTSDRNAN